MTKKKVYNFGNNWFLPFINSLNFISETEKGEENRNCTEIILFLKKKVFFNYQLNVYELVPDIDIVKILYMDIAQFLYKAIAKAGNPY